MNQKWRSTELSNVLEPVARFEDRDELDSYQFAGTYSYARGIFRGDLKSGSSFNLSKIQRIKEGDFIYCKIMAWEGAFGLAGPDVDGCVMSGAFVAYRPNEEYVDPDFLNFWFKTESNWKLVAASSTGTNVRRKSLHPDDFGNCKIGLPPISEQRRITRHLKAINSRLTHVKNMRAQQLVEMAAFTVSFHHNWAESNLKRMGHLLEIVEEKEPIDPSGSYPQVGIRSFGNGMFKKPAISGTETSYRAFNTLRTGMFVMSQVKGWEGAVAVCDDELDGWFVSPEYRTFSCIEDACDAEYLSYLVQTEWFHKQLAEATRGQGARRERVRPEMLLELEMPFPRIEDQRRAVQVLRNLHKIKAQAAKIEVRHEALMPSLLDRIFNQHDTTGLGD